MVNTRNKVKCVGCGKINELELAYLESLTAPVRILEEELLPQPGYEDEESVDKQEAAVEDVVTLTLGECEDCGNMHWIRMGEMSVSVVAPRDEKTEQAEKAAVEKHKCVACGELAELEAENMPVCAICGALDWEKVPI